MQSYEMIYEACQMKQRYLLIAAQISLLQGETAPL